MVKKNSNKINENYENLKFENYNVFDEYDISDDDIADEILLCKYLALMLKIEEIIIEIAGNFNRYSATLSLISSTSSILTPTNLAKKVPLNMCAYCSKQGHCVEMCLHLPENQHNLCFNCTSEI